MSDTKEKHATFTPGPWEYSTTYMGRSEVYIGPDEKTGGHCVVYSKNHYKDARLIAVAPEMYEMCKLLEECMENIDGKDGWDASYELAKVREVLAKVKGGEG